MKLLKSLTVFTIILSLFSFHIESRAIGFSSAYAEESTDDSGDKTFVSDKDPNKPHLDYRDSEQKIGKQSVAQMMTILAMVMGPSIAMACMQPISGKIFAAGGVAYLAMEVMNYGKYKKASTSNQEMYATLDPDTADKQIEAFTYAEQQELTAASALGKKASALNIFFMAMTAAAVMALIEGIRAIYPPQAGTDVCTGTVTSIDYKKLFYASFDNALGFVFPSAMAKEAEKVQGPMGTMGILSLAAGAILAYKGVAKGFLQSALSNGFVRAAIFGVFAGFAMAAKAEVNKAKKKAEENAAVYASLRDRLIQALNSASQFAGMSGVKGAARTLPRYQAIRDEMNSLSGGAICMIGKLGEQRIDEKCLCAKNNTCSKAEFSSVGLTNQGLPSSFASGIDNLAGGVNSMFAGNTAAADSSFGNLAQGAAALRKLNKQMVEKANAVLAKSKTPTSMEKLESQMESELRKRAPGMLNSLSNDAKALALGTGLSGTGVAASDLEKAKDGDLKDVLASISSKAAAPIGQKGVGEFKFDFPTESEEASADTVQLAQMEQEKAAMGDFKEEGGDISSRPFENIFKIITVRYFKSAYPRIFEEDKKSSLE
tara:strand:- start:3218 stop:5017 length:1800 start_codon:yes stop_codon:yes gene_type:complete